MYQFEAERTTGTKNVHLLVASVLLMTGLGLVVLYSSSYAFADRFYNNSYHFISKQLVFGGGGLILFFLVSFIPLEWVRKYITFFVAAAAALCFCTFIPGVGVERLSLKGSGALRWIKIGTQTYQPSEAVKIVLPVYLAHIFDKKQEKLDSFFSGILPQVLITALFFALIYAQNNFSTAVFIVLNALIIFFLAGLRFRYFLSALVMFVPAAALLVFTKEHRVRRLLSFIRPEWDPLGAGFQVRSSLLTINSGGLWGKGIGQGTRKIASVPEIHSDFIFSAFSEEAGFIGVLLFFALLGIFAFLGYRAAWRSNSVFKRLLASGLVTMVISQALLNVAVVSGALPATGIPLPFFSAGGSSLATTLICAGLIVNVARRPGEEFSGAEMESRRQEARFSVLEGQDVR
jgi:cell division protein FtsW